MANSRPAPELLISDVRVADGTGAPIRRRDVRLADGRIAEVAAPGSLSAPAAATLRPGPGSLLTPGFIDAHSHADLSPLLGEPDTTKLLQGVTTEVVGNCGMSPAPVPAGAQRTTDLVTGRLFPNLPIAWTGFRSWAERLDAVGSLVNVAPLVGHGTLREAVLGAAARPSTPAERAAMRAELEDALAAGAFGFSSGLIYAPGVHGDREELAELFAALGPEHVYATHMRNESSRLSESIAEALDTALVGAGRLHVSHLKAAGRANWGGVARALEQLDAARARGRRVSQDIYPYTATSTTLAICLPPWAQEAVQADAAGALADPAFRERILRAIRTERDGDWENMLQDGETDGIVVSSTPSGAFVGRSLTEIGADRGQDPLEALLDVLRLEGPTVSMVEHAMAEDDLVLALRHPETTIGSDGLPFGLGGTPHPRLYGTFPRVLGRYAREQGVLSIAEAVHRMTGLAAATFSIPERGEIRPGAVADLVLLDEATVADTATYADPVRTPLGIEWVMLAGERVAEHGAWTGRRAGRRLRPAP